MGACGSALSPTPDSPDSICLYCKRFGRGKKPNRTNPMFKSGKVCNTCFDKLGMEAKVVLEHRLGQHEKCAKFRDFPAEELQYEANAYHSQRCAEWRHEHKDHSLCKPHYVLGCTVVEQERDVARDREANMIRHTQIKSSRLVALQEAESKQRLAEAAANGDGAEDEFGLGDDFDFGDEEQEEEIPTNPFAAELESDDDDAAAALFY
jgi:hypothetical protein